MIFDDTTYRSRDEEALSWKETYKARRAYWPELYDRNKDVHAISNTWALGSDSNFWTIGEQYYVLAWSLFTMGYRDQMNLPYTGNISTPQDSDHQQYLKNRIFRNGWGFIQILGNAHLACEMALKSMCLHLAKDVHSAKFPKTHDLEKIFKSLPTLFQRQVKEEFDDWANKNSANENFMLIVNNSGARFVAHRYDHPETIDSTNLGTIGLSRFFYEIFLEDNT